LCAFVYIIIVHPTRNPTLFQMLHLPHWWITCTPTALVNHLLSLLETQQNYHYTTCAQLPVTNRSALTWVSWGGQVQWKLH